MIARPKKIALDVLKVVVVVVVLGLYVEGARGVLEGRRPL
jgi:hypothetical protein